MNLVTALARLATFERSIGALYDWLAQVIPEREVASVFGRLAFQEQNHANLLEQVRRVALHNRQVSSLVGLDLVEVDALAASIEALLHREQRPDAAEAVSAAMLIELSATERVHGPMTTIGDPDLRKLFLTLAREDDRHVRELMDLGERLERTAA